jgi:hypothetical protein
MDESLAAALPAHATSAPISAPPFPFHARSYDAQQQRSTMGDLIASMLVRSGHTLTCAIAQVRVACDRLNLPFCLQFVRLSKADFYFVRSSNDDVDFRREGHRFFLQRHV